MHSTASIRDPVKSYRLPTKSIRSRQKSRKQIIPRAFTAPTNLLQARKQSFAVKKMQFALARSYIIERSGRYRSAIRARPDESSVVLLYHSAADPRAYFHPSKCHRNQPRFSPKNRPGQLCPRAHERATTLSLYTICYFISLLVPSPIASSSSSFLLHKALSNALLVFVRACKNVCRVEENVSFERNTEQCVTSV